MLSIPAVKPAVAWFVFCAGILAAAPANVTWERRAYGLPESIWSVEAIDVNGDGRKDLVAMGVTKVFAVSGAGGSEQVLADTKEGKMLYCVALDADGDGDQDLAVGRYLIPWIAFRQARDSGKNVPEPQGPDFSVAWLENPGRAGSAAWRMHVVDRELNGIHGLWVGDVDRDGRMDVISNSISGPAFPNSVAWFKLPRERGGVAEREVVTKAGADGRPHYLDFGDVNGDGRGDVLLGDSGGGTFTWWERKVAAGAAPAWEKHRIAQEKGATNIKAEDVDRDGAIDVIGACGHGRGVYWFRGGGWEKHVIDAELATPHALAIGDFDGDGDIDAAVASYTAFVVRWYENDGKGRFTAHDIDTGNRQQAYDLKAVDFDGDGRKDLILAGRESRNAVVFLNRPAAMR